MNLEGKIALVTGSGRNIGRATALELARRGADVVVNARANFEEANAVAEEARALGVRAAPLLVDLGDDTQVNRLMDAAVTELRPIDILVNNARIRRSTPLVEMSLEEWWEVMAVNLDGPFYCCKAVAPGMIARGWGRIINVSGLNAFAGQADWAHVCASKLGALGLTLALAQELAPHRILVNHIVPGAFDITPTAVQSPILQTVADIPLGRLGIPDKVARTCAFLASDEASYITGQTLHINEGALTY